MTSLKPVRGTHDLMGEDARRHRHVVNTFRNRAERYGFGEIATPIFEFTEVFQRTLGETSDVVQKEMYTFEDRGGERITLRPEFTAGVARAFISGGLTQNLPCKFFSHGPVFRYERPQKGRMRQFHQVNMEVLGVAEPQADIEVIAIAAGLLRDLGVADKTTCELNTLGDSDSRAAYRDVLVDYFSAHRSDLSEDSLARLERNPLRILDSKDQGDRKLVGDAPRMADYLNTESADFFSNVCAGLDRLGVPYTVNDRLVRGLDYYTHTAFEFTTDALGAQGTVLAGGRYDGLIEQMGGKPTPGIGWAGGLERLGMLLEETPVAPRPITVIPIGEAAQGPALSLAEELRSAGFYVDMGYRGNVGKRMKRADKLGARVALFLGDDELAEGIVKMRDLDSGEEAAVPISDAVVRLSQYK
jgi:histidyl-tRNA synthetase